MTQTLNNIYHQTGFTVREFTRIAQKNNVNIVKDRIVELVKMYESNPERLNKLVQECLT